jgi:hypothetical protein
VALRAAGAGVTGARHLERRRGRERPGVRRGRRRGRQHPMTDWLRTAARGSAAMGWRVGRRYPDRGAGAGGLGDGRGAGLKLTCSTAASSVGSRTLSSDQGGRRRDAALGGRIPDVHPRGVLLWIPARCPTGVDAHRPAVAQRLVLADGAERRVTIRASLASQLAAAGCKAGDVRISRCRTTTGTTRPTPTPSPAPPG